MSKNAKRLTLIASILLLLMGAFHASGSLYVIELFNSSNAEGFLKEIFPVLFLHPSLQLAVLGGFGIYSFFLKSGHRPILFLLSMLVLIDSVLAFVLAAWMPGLLLLIASVLLFLAAKKVST